FGRRVDEININIDFNQVYPENGAQTLVYLQDVQREKYKLVFEGGRVKRYPYNRPDLDPDVHNGLHALEWADTNSRVGEVVELGRNNELQRQKAAGFVLGHDREFYMTGHMASVLAAKIGGKGVKHSSYFAGANVLFAGEIRINNGYIEQICCGS